MRYRRNKIIRNKDPIYEEVIEGRGKNFIRQYALPKYRRLTKEQIGSLETVPHVWSEGDRYYKLAQYFYGDPALWWVIAWFNKKPTETHVALGDTIYIPMPLHTILNLYNV